MLTPELLNLLRHGECWLIAPNGTARRQLEFALTEAGVQNDRLSLLKLANVSGWLNRQLLQSPRLLGRNESVLLVESLLRKYGAELPYFNKLLVGGEESLEAVAGTVAEALRRLAEQEVPPEKAQGRLGELLRLTRWREELLEQLNAEEPFERCRRLARLLDADADELTPPERIVLYKPGRIGAGEQRLLAALSRRTEEFVSYLETAESFESKAAASPSQRHGAATTVLVKKLGRVIVAEAPEKERERICRWLFDGEGRPEELLQSISPWLARNRRDEVLHVVREVKRQAIALSTRGKANLSGLQIVLPSLDQYSGLLAAELSSRGLPFSMPAGEPVRSSTPAVILHALLDYLQQPGREELYRYWGHPAVKPPQLPTAAEAQEELSELAQLLPEPGEYDNPAEFWFAEAIEGTLDPHRLDSQLRRARVNGLPRNWDKGLSLKERLREGWARPLLSQLRRRRPNEEREPKQFKRWIRSTRRSLFSLAALMKQQTALSQLALDGQSEREVGKLMELLREELAQRGVYKNLIRGALRQLNEETKNSDPVRAISERRRAESVSRSWNELTKTMDAVVEVAKFSKEELGQPLLGLRRFRRLLDAELANQAVHIPGPDHGVMVYRLDETAALPLKTVFVLGLTNDSFPGKQSFSLLPGRLRHGEASPVDESMALLSRIIRRADRVWLSAPKHSERGETKPTATLSDLLDWWDELEQQPVIPGADPLLQPTNQGELLRAAATDSQLSASLKESYQQAVESLGLDESLPLQSELIAPLMAAAPQRSITEFETFISCPRKYLFRHLLHLMPPQTVEDEVEANVVGSLAHRALEIFFNGQEKRGLAPWSGGQLDEVNFEDARQRMLQAAGLAFLDHGLILRNQADYLKQARSGIDGALVPLNAQRGELVSGLAEDEERSPGTLLRALLLQKDRIKSLPTYTEFEFTDETALRIGELRLRGRIDRIDYTAGEELAIYDYKTGGVKKPNDIAAKQPYGGLRTLQLPLYLLAARQQFGEQTERCRAAEVSLKKYIPPDDSSYYHPAENGPLVEHAAIHKKGGWVFSYDAVDDQLDYARDAVQEIWREVQSGQLINSQLSKTTAITCKSCDYKDICGLEPEGRRLSRMELKGEGE